MLCPILPLSTVPICRPAYPSCCRLTQSGGQGRRKYEKSERESLQGKLARLMDGKRPWLVHEVWLVRSMSPMKVQAPDSRGVSLEMVPGAGMHGTA